MTDDDDNLTGPTVFRRQLGRELRTLREYAGYTIDAAAKAMELSRSKFGRIERGMVSVRSLEVKQMCELYGASQQLTEALVEVARKTREKGWWHSFTSVMPETFEMYVGLETAAATIRQYEAELIPGLFQTEPYAAMLVRAHNPGIDEAVVEHRVALRMKRQRLLRRIGPPPLEVSVLLNEGILLRPIGGPDVMAGQLAHLNKLAQLPNVAIRIVPHAAGLHSGVMTGPFIILNYLDVNDPPTVYMDGYTGDLYLEKKDDVTRYNAAYADISRHALDQTESRELIARAAKEYQR